MPLYPGGKDPFLSGRGVIASAPNGERLTLISVDDTGKVILDPEGAGVAFGTAFPAPWQAWTPAISNLANINSVTVLSAGYQAIGTLLVDFVLLVLVDFTAAGDGTFDVVLPIALAGPQYGFAAVQFQSVLAGISNSYAIQPDDKLRITVLNVGIDPATQQFRCQYFR